MFQEVGAVLHSVEMQIFAVWSLRLVEKAVKAVATTSSHFVREVSQTPNHERLGIEYAVNQYPSKSMCHA